MLADAHNPKADTTEDTPKSLAACGLYTETLAHIYWRQGFLSEALHIYRHLATDRPHEPRLQEHIHRLLDELATSSLAQAAPSGTAVPTPLPEAVSHTPPDWRFDAIRSLERWLAYLQQQRQKRNNTAIPAY